mmetsp:Transcript_29230/g.63563  ORF Transcript_29230/g.63563 Transcript_29230/m.63563 type:complete len:277 (+) Transcript_29230:419-1249(+)
MATTTSPRVATAWLRAGQNNQLRIRGTHGDVVRAQEQAVLVALGEMKARARARAGAAWTTKVTARATAKAGAMTCPQTRAAGAANQARATVRVGETTLPTVAAGALSQAKATARAMARASLPKLRPTVGASRPALEAGATGLAGRAMERGKAHLTTGRPAKTALLRHGARGVDQATTANLDPQAGAILGAILAATHAATAAGKAAAMAQKAAAAVSAESGDLPMPNAAVPLALGACHRPVGLPTGTLTAGVRAALVTGAENEIWGRTGALLARAGA